MNKIFLILTMALLPFMAQSEPFNENEHFEVIKQTATEKPEVMEFFSFYCGHCNKFSPIIDQLENELPESVPVKKIHVDFLGREMGPILTNAYAASQMLNIDDKFEAKVFNKLHYLRENIDGTEGVLNVFEALGVSSDDAMSALESFPVTGLASQMKRNTEKFEIRGVPTIIVNGKYQVNLGSVKSSDELISLIKFLTNKTN